MKRVELEKPSTTVQEANIPTDQHRWRWAVIIVFGFSSALNYLDRQLLAAVAPSVKQEFGLSNTEYGALVSAFSITYMLATPFAGLFIDRIGLTKGTMIAVAAWSVVGSLTSIVRSFTGLFLARMGLGVAEAAGIPASSKASASYLKPAEVGLGNGIQSVDITLGAIAAPLFAAAILPSYGWRGVFLFCGALGLVWIPLWWFTSRLVPPTKSSSIIDVSVPDLVRDRRLWGIFTASALVMTVHSLWLNWTTVYLVQEWHLTQEEANRFFSWIPPIFASLGGLAGGWWGLYMVRSSQTPVQGRLRACTAAAPLFVTTAIIPLLPSALLSIVGISVSFFACMVVLINLHVIPIHLFGVKRAAFAAALLASSYAVMQAIFSPIIGAMVDYSNFSVVLVFVSAISLVGLAVLRWSVR